MLGFSGKNGKAAARACTRAAAMRERKKAVGAHECAPTACRSAVRRSCLRHPIHGHTLAAGDSATQIAEAPRQNARADVRHHHASRWLNVGINGNRRGGGLSTGGGRGTKVRARPVARLIIRPRQSCACLTTAAYRGRESREEITYPNEWLAAFSRSSDFCI